MAEPTAFSDKPASVNPRAESAFPTEYTPPPVVYQRISGFAIASLAVGVLFALFLIIAGVWALRDQAPILLPVYLQAVPCIGAGLALIAMFFIAGSEGTLAGRRLAVWGLGISLTGVLTYWAYFGALSMAISNQAEAFTRAWFQKIIDGEAEDYGGAFLDTQDPAARQKYNPKNKKEINQRFLMALPASADGIQRGPFATFREKDIVQVLRQGGKDSQIRSLGVRDWEYKAGGYSVKQAFVVTTNDGAFEILVTVHGLESQTREFEGRAWYVVYSESVVSNKSFSPDGQRVRFLGQGATNFMQQWWTKLYTGWPSLAYLDTLDPKDRQRKGTAFAAQLLVYGLSGSNGSFMLSREGAGEWHRIEYSALLFKNVALKYDRLDTDDESVTKPAVIAGTKRLLGSGESGPLFAGMVNFKESMINPWRYEDHRLRLPLDVKMGFSDPSTQKEYEVAAIITAESTPGALETNEVPGWRIVSVELIDGKDRNKVSEAGPGAPKMPRGMKKGVDPKFAPPPRLP